MNFLIIIIKRKKYNILIQTFNLKRQLTKITTSSSRKYLSQEMTKKKKVLKNWQTKVDKFLVKN